jgi:hypothetical protein
MKADGARFAPARRLLPVQPSGESVMDVFKEYQDRPLQDCCEVLRADLA